MNILKALPALRWAWLARLNFDFLKFVPPDHRQALAPELERTAAWAKQREASIGEPLVFLPPFTDTSAERREKVAGWAQTTCGDVATSLLGLQRQGKQSVAH